MGEGSGHLFLIIFSPKSSLYIKGSDSWPDIAIYFFPIVVVSSFNFVNGAVFFLIQTVKIFI